MKTSLPLVTAEPVPTMLERAMLLFVILSPLAAVVGISIYVCFYGKVSLFYIALMLVFHVSTALGITIGFHRLFTHDSFRSKQWLKLVLGILGSMALQGKLIDWCSTHSQHHKFTEREGDPHSPWRYGRRFKDVCKGFFYAHVLWILNEPVSRNKLTQTLRADPVASFVNRFTLLWFGLSMLLPIGMGIAYESIRGGSILAGAGQGFLWGFLVRLFLTQHITWMVNSVCHVWGTRPFETPDESRDNPLIALLAMGEGYHNGHHAKPNSAKHGLHLGWLDTSYWVIRILEWLGLVWRVSVPSREEIARMRKVSN